MAWLSSWKCTLNLLGSSASHKSRVGMSTFWSAKNPATISASGVEVEIEVCLTDRPAIGNLLNGPSSDRCTPDVERLVSGHPAKSASAYKWGSRFSHLSPITPVMRWCNVDWT